VLRLTEKQYARLMRGEPIGRASKFGNKKTQVDGLWFDSAWEARHYQELKLLELAGCIRKLQRQVKFVLTMRGARITSICLDFVYEERTPTGWTTVYSDAKSQPTRTRAWRMKAKMFLAQYGSPIREVFHHGRR
jgi:hypothetical protein